MSFSLWRPRALLKRWRNHRAVDVCGEGAELRGTVHKRHAQSRIEIGARSRIDGYLTTETAGSLIRIGSDTLVGPGTIVDCAAEIQIGSNVLISYDCVIGDADNHSLNAELRRDDLARWRRGEHDWSTVAKAPVKIGDGAWIGARSILLKGVTIGEGAVVGMGSVVTKDVAPYTVVAGNPARLIRALR